MEMMVRSSKKLTDVAIFFRQNGACIVRVGNAYSCFLRKNGSTSGRGQGLTGSVRLRMQAQLAIGVEIIQPRRSNEVVQFLPLTTLNNTQKTNDGCRYGIDEPDIPILYSDHPVPYYHHSPANLPPKSSLFSLFWKTLNCFRIFVHDVASFLGWRPTQRHGHCTSYFMHQPHPHSAYTFSFSTLKNNIPHGVIPPRRSAKICSKSHEQF